MIRNNDIIHGYTVLAVVNGIILAHSATAPDPYVVWHTTEDGSDVYGGKYMTSKDDAEWDFCAKAFPWFEDNAPINIIEDKAAEKIDSFKWYLDGAKERVESCRSVLDEIQEAIDNATALVEDMVAEHEKLISKKEAPQEENAEQEPFCTRDFAGRGHREIAAQSKKEQSNPIWTAAPRLAIDEHGISLSGVYLPGTTRFLLKDSGDLDGTFILDIETDVVLATAPGKSTVAEHENPVDKKEAPQCSPAEQKINKIVAHVTEIIENNLEIFTAKFSSTLSSVDDIDSLTKDFGCGFPIRYTAQSIWEKCSTKILQDIWDVDTPLL